MQGVRAVIPGAEVLLGLLLTVALTRRSAELDDLDRYIDVANFARAVVALLLTSPPQSVTQG